MKRWWERGTLRFRLALWYGVGGAVLFAAFSATLYFYVAKRMAQPLGAQHRGDLAVLEQRLKVQPDGRVLWDGRSIGPRSQSPTDYPWFELWDEQGRLVRRFWPFTANRATHVPVAPVAGRETISVFNVAPDLRIRSLSLPYKVPGREADWMIRVMRIHVPAADPLDTLGVIIVVSLPVVIALLVVGGYLITRRWLRPLDLMVTEANRITADDLSRRLPVHNAQDELGRLASVFNVTLDRLEESFDALDRFVADASHELRTPLTTLRSVGEVGLRRSRTVEEYREIIGSMLEEAQRLQLLIERLLELASTEGGAAATHRTAIKVDEVVTACVGELGILAEARSQQIVIESMPCAVATDVVIFRQALQNLLDNAIKYSPPNTTIRVTVREGDGKIDVAVTDSGPGISHENRTRLTDRFFRPDRGRGRDSGGFGLGLSITKAYMRVLGGALEYEPATAGGSTFRLSLPKA